MNKTRARMLSGVAYISLAGVLFSNAAGAGSLTLDQATLNSIANTELQTFIDSTNVPGAAMGVSIGGSSYTGGAGYTSLSKTTPVTANTQFRIGSQTKTYTGTVVLQLVDQGLLTLNTTVGSVLGNVLPTVNGVNYNNVTVDQLLRMNAGIPEYLQSQYKLNGQTTNLLNAWNSTNNGQLPMSEQQILNQIVSMATTNPSSWGTPGGTSPSYTNSDYTILSMMAEKLTGQSMASLIQTNIVSKLGLKNTLLATTGQAVGLNNSLTTTVNNPGSSSANLSHGYFDSNAGPGTALTSATPDFVNADPSIPGAAGGMLSSAADELVWVKQLAANQYNLLTSTSQANRVAFNVNGMGVSNKWAYYGEAIYKVVSDTGNTMIGHSGLLSGYQSSVLYEPTTGISVVGNINNSQAFNQAGEPISILTLLYGTESAVYRAATANGQCAASGTTTTCSGSTVTVNGQTFGTGQTLHILQSGQTGLQNTTFLDDSLEAVGNSTVTVPLNTLSYYGLNGSAVTLGGGASLVVDAGSGTEAQISATGTNSNAVLVQGNGNSLQIYGNLAASGSGANAINVQGSNNAVHLASTSQVSGNILLSGANTLTADAGSQISTSVGSAVSLAGKAQATLNGTISASHDTSAYLYPGTPDTVYGLSVGGSGNGAKVGGTIDTRATLILYDDAGNASLAYQNDPFALGIYVEGSGNSVTLASAGKVYGDVAITGRNTLTLNGLVSGSVTTDTDTTLNGNGIITGNLSGGGIVSPGNGGPGTLTVGGVFDAANATLQISNPGQAVHAGMASLTGGTVQAHLPGDSYYSLVSTDLGIVGKFSGVNVADGTVVYDKTAAHLVSVNPSSAAALSHSAVTGMNSVSRLVANHLATQSGEMPAPQHNGFDLTASDGNGQTRFESLANALGAAPLSAFDPKSGIGAWASGYASRDMNKSMENAASTDSLAVGVSGGGDYTFSNGLMVGGLLGWQKEDGHTGSGAQTDGHVEYVGLYGSAPLPGDMTLSAMAVYGHGSTNVDRQVTSGSGSSLTHSSQKDDRISLDARLSRSYQLEDSVTLTPYARLNWVEVLYDGYSESGTAALRVNGSRFSELRPELGATASAANPFGLAWLRPRLGASVSREIILQNNSRDAQLIGFGGVFQVSGSEVNRYVFGATAGADVDFGQNLIGSLDTGADFSSSSIGYRVLGKIKTTF